jgi:predicted nucleic acid-binding protein
MIKIVLDANQFISAILIPKSKPAKILDLVRDEKVRLVILGY